MLLFDSEECRPASPRAKLYRTASFTLKATQASDGQHDTSRHARALRVTSCCTSLRRRQALHVACESLDKRTTIPKTYSGRLLLAVFLFVFAATSCKNPEEVPRDVFSGSVTKGRHEDLNGGEFAPPPLHLITSNTLAVQADAIAGAMNQRPVEK